MTERLYIDVLTRRLKLVRLLWIFVYYLAYRWLPRLGFGWWRVFILKCFGAEIGKGCRIAPSCRIWAPWNLKISDYVCLADEVDCYCVGRIELHSYVTISQRSFLCTASHDINSLRRPLIHAPIEIEEHAWVCAQAVICPGVSLGVGSVVAAGSVVTKNVNAWEVVGGNPAKLIKTRNVCDGFEALNK
jgi:putative colanic acid biosynthesis acetyltransferase WcaF